MKIVAVTSCPTGIAHTYMAAEALEQARQGRRARHQGRDPGRGRGRAARPTPIIAAADAVVFAADVEVRDRERFAGKPLVQTSVKRAINDAAGLIAEAEAAARPRRGGVPAAAGTEARERLAMDTAGRPETKVDQGAGFGTRLRQWLMTGVSYMIPFVAAGGILIALTFMLGGPEVANKVNGGTFQGVEYPAVERPVQPDRAGRLRRADVQDRRRRLLHAGPDPGRLHRLRHGRPAGPGRPASSAA